MKQRSRHFNPLRSSICTAALGLLLLSLSACEEQYERVYLNISMFSYLDRPIFDVHMNGTDFMGASAHAFYGSNGVMLNQPITLGRQKVTWRFADTGETVIAKNSLELKEIPHGMKWLALHIYKDDTVELAFSKGSPDDLSTEPGKKIIGAWGKENAK